MYSIFSFISDHFAISFLGFSLPLSIPKTFKVYSLLSSNIFFKSGSYSSLQAYALLYTDYKENFFPTLDNFKKYFIDYFPSDFSLDYTNIERLGSIYVMWVSVKDTVNGSRYGKNFDMNVVVQENDLNDFVISFSRDSAVNNTREEE